MRSQWRGFQSPLGDGIRRFLSSKRAIGRRFHSEEMTLRMFDRFLTKRKVLKIQGITTTVVDAFLAAQSHRRPRSYNALLSIVRRLFDWLVIQGELSRSPLHARPRRDGSRRIPFIIEINEGRHLLKMARQLPDNSRALLRGPTYHAIFATLWALGLRVGEVARLRCGDVDLPHRLLLIRNTKFGKSRMVPFGPRLTRVLTRYLQLRARARGVPLSDAALFSFSRGKAIHPGTITQTFHALLPRLHFTRQPGVASPRVHDLRHAFAVRTLLHWYRAGTDPSARLLQLATFLGHVNISSTAVYLTITDALLNEAGARFERFASPSIGQVMP